MKERETRDVAAGRPGTRNAIQENSHSVRIGPWFASVLQDLKYATRSLLHAPGFTLAAVGALVIGISLNTSLFSVFNAFALRSWPVRDPARVIDVYHTSREGGAGGFPAIEYRYLAAHARGLTGVAATHPEWVQFDNESSTKHLEAHFVSGNYFDVLGAGMQLGRGFLASEDRPEAPDHVVVLSYRLWRNRFGGDPAILGRTLRIAGARFEVVGVAAEEFTGTHTTHHDLWFPLSSIGIVRPDEAPSRNFLTSPENCCVDVVARMARGVTRAQAAAELTALSARYAEAYGQKPREVAVAGTSYFEQPNRRQGVLAALMLMFAGMTMVLLLACANVGNLLIARAVSRQREIAVRLSLGAGRLRLVRQLLTESAVIAVVAGAIGLAAAWWLPTAIFSFMDEPPPFRTNPDVSVLLYTACLVVVTCLLFGLAPALHATRTKPSGGIRRDAGMLETRYSLRSALLAIQVALSIVLLVGAGLMLRGVQNARSMDPGFAIRDVSVTSLDLPANAYNAQARRALFAQIATSMSETPNLRNAGWAARPPFARSVTWMGFQLANESQESWHRAFYGEVAGDYFRVLNIPVVAGRTFEPADAGRPYAVVNESLARECWPGQDPIGKTIAKPPLQIIGVVKDVGVAGLNSVEPTLFRMFEEDPAPVVLARTGPGSNPGQEIAAIVRRIDPRIEVKSRPLSELLSDSLLGARMGAFIAAAVGVLALGLAAIGIFGMFSYAAQQRTKEIGIRCALGATRAQAIGLVLGSSAKPLAAGLIAGLAGAAALSTLMRKFLFGVSTLDPLTYAWVLAVMTAAATLACALPARRAAKVDPAVALRYE